MSCISSPRHISEDVAISTDQEVEQVEQFLEVVLQGRSGEQEGVPDRVFQQGGEEKRSASLEPVSLVDHQHLRCTQGDCLPHLIP